MTDNLFSSIKIGNIKINNRLVVPPMVTIFANEDGTASEVYMAYLEEKAKGGWGIIIPENYAISKESRGFLKLPGLWNNYQIDSHKTLTDRLHKYNVKVFAQLNHAGRQTSRKITGCQPVAPSPLPDPTINEIPKELSISEIKAIVRQFGEAALRAKKAGFDGVEVHGAHGYLINQFVSPFSNKRTDEYGGNLMARMKLPLDVIADIRSKVGENFPLIYRMSANEFVEGGLSTEDSVVIASILEEAGIDAIHVSNGVYASSQYIIPPSAVKEGWSSNISAEIKAVVNIPVITVGRINNPLLASSIIRTNKADLVSMGRASIADPYLPLKTKNGEYTSINKCIGCLQGCAGRNVQQLPIKCLVNPVIGNESKVQAQKTVNQKRVTVVGGGPAGMQAAITASKNGHIVDLYESKDRLGGQLLQAAIPPNKSDINQFIRNMVQEIKKSDIRVHLNTQVTEEMLTESSADAIIFATGVKPIVPKIEGIEKKHVVLAQDILNGKINSGENVVVIGGGLVGAETAEHLANHGKKVTIVEKMDKLVAKGQPAVRYFLLQDMKEHDVIIYTNSTVESISDTYVNIKTSDKSIKLENVDTVVLALGSVSNNVLYEKMRYISKCVKLIGDASEVRSALEAVEEGFQAGMNI
ncbi:FAD-dependent oxidoreductase [Mycoplasmatota bacterium]|nr:FAD-dependent oxidoreductase [Mycoplasmatota bacterium]